MKGAVIYFGIFLVLFAVVCRSENKPVYDLNELPSLYVKYRKDFNRTYVDDYDLLIHYEAFKKSVLIINKNNQNENSTHTDDLNDLSDLTDEELKKKHGFGP